MAYPKVKEDFFEKTPAQVVGEDFFSEEPVKKKVGTTASGGGEIGGTVGGVVSKAQSGFSASDLGKVGRSTSERNMPFISDTNKPVSDNVMSGSMKQQQSIKKDIAADNTKYITEERPKEIEAKAKEIKEQPVSTEPAFDGVDFMKQDIIEHGGGKSLADMPSNLESLNLYFGNDANNAADYFKQRTADIDSEIKDLYTSKQQLQKPSTGDISTGVSKPQIDPITGKSFDYSTDEEKGTDKRIAELKDYKNKLVQAQSTLAKKYAGWLAKDEDVTTKGKFYDRIMGDEYAQEQQRLEDKGIPITQEQKYNTDMKGLEVSVQELNDEYEGMPKDEIYYERLAHLNMMEKGILNKYPEYKRQQGGKLIAQLAMKDEKLRMAAQVGSGELDKEIKTYLKNTYGISEKDLKGLDYGDIPSETMWGNIAKGVTDAAAGIVTGVTRIAGTVAGVDEDRLTHINEGISRVGSEIFGDNPYAKLQESETLVNRDLKTIANPNAGKYNYNAETIKNAVGSGIGGLIGFIGGTKGVGKVLSLTDDAAMTSYLIGSGFEHNYQKANEVMGKDASEVSKGLYATGMGYLEALAFKVLPKDKIFFGSAESKAAQKELAKTLTGVTLETVNRGALESGFRKVLKAAAGTTEETAKIGGAMSIAEMAKTATAVLLGEDKDAAKFYGEGVSNIEHLVKDLPFSMGIPLGLMEIPKYAQHSNRTKQILFDAGSNPDTHIATIRQAQEKGLITEAEADKKIEVVETMKNIVKSLPDKNPKTNEPLTQKQQAEYAYNRVKEIAVKTKGDEIKDAALAPFYKKEAQELVDERTAIVTGEHEAYKEMSDIYDRVKETGKHDKTLNAGTKTQGVEYLQEQALTAPNSFKNQTNRNTELVVDLIARNPKEDIKAEIKGWKEKIKPDATQAETEAIQKHIDLLEAGLEKQKKPKVEEVTEVVVETPKEGVTTPTESKNNDAIPPTDVVVDVKKHLEDKGFKENPDGSFNNGKVTVRVKDNLKLDDNSSYKQDANSIVLDDIALDKENRGKGLGKSAMNDLFEYADANGKSIYLEPMVNRPDSKMTKDQLVKWYEKLGFEVINEDVMIRKPQSLSKELPSKGADVVVDKVYYHGTPNKDFKGEFDENRIGERDSGFLGTGFYFTEDKGMADQYRHKGGKKGKILERSLDIKNPLILDKGNVNPKELAEDIFKYIDEQRAKNGKEPYRQESREADIAELTKGIEDAKHGIIVGREIKGWVNPSEYAKSRGYDAIIGSKEILVFDKSQIKEQPSNKQEVVEAKEGFTEGADLNKIYAGLKAKYGDKKAATLYEVANRLVNPNTNTIVEIRGNGVVVKEGGKYILKPFGNTDANSKKWTLYKGLDVTDQFANTKEQAKQEVVESNQKTKNEEAKVTPDTKSTEEGSNAKKLVSEDAQQAGKFEEKARKLAEKIMAANVVPDWLKIDDPNVKKSGADAETIKKALADATIKMGKLLDKGVEFGEAVKEAVKDLVDLMGEGMRSKIEDGFSKDYEKDFGKKEPPKEPTEPVGGKGDKDRMNDKGILNHLESAKNVPDAAKEGFRGKGLKYETKSQKEAEDVAKSVIDQYGIEDAVLLAEAQKFDGDVNSLIYAESLNRLAKLEDTAKTPEEKLSFVKQFAEVGIKYDEAARKGGRFSSAINYFYKKSPLGIQMIENAKRKEQFEQWAKPKEKSWKEFFDEMVKEPEFDAIIKEQVSEGMKKERAEARAERIKKVDEFFDKAKDQFKGGAAYSTIIPPKVITTALEGMKQAYHAGEKVAKIIEDAIDYISKELGNASWDKDKFRKEWEEKLKDKPDKKKLTDEEVKAKILDRFRNKLKGLSDKQKEDVVRKSFQKIVESGGLDYADFRKIIAEVTGRNEMTDAEAAKLKELVAETNKVDDAATKARTERTPESLKAYREAEVKAGTAQRELNTLLYNRPNVMKRLTSMLQLNTLGVAALVNNPVYNIINQLGIRVPIGIIETGVDKAIQAVGKIFGKEINPETDVLSLQVQKEFFKKLGLGGREALGQFLTGLNRMDYIQKEIHGQQIRPITSMKELWEFSRGERNLTKTQVVDKLLQALPQGWTAEIIARTLNLGDKPQRFAAEGAKAASFAKTLGVKDIDYKLFIEFPREEAYRVYKAKGLSDAEAAKKADHIRDTIIKSGERSTFQQDNFANDILNRIFGGKDSGVGGLVKATVVSPYIKIPANAYWSYFNIVNPEVAMLQSAIYGAKAFAKRNGNVKFSFDKNNSTAAKDLVEAKYWFAHAAVGFATRAVITSLVGAGIFRSSNTADDTKKEREGEQFYEAQGTVNVDKLWAWMNGKNPDEVKNGLVVQNRWFGHWGSVGNTIAKREEEMTDEQKENRDDYWSEVLANIDESALPALEQGIFGNTSSLLTALNRGGSTMQAWGVNTMNMFTNIIHPAAFAQVSKAQLPYYTKTKADSFGEELKNAMLTRSSWLRKASGQYPPSKISIWGDKIEKEGNVVQKLFGFSKSNDDNFAQPIYEDYKKTDNTKFFPSAVKPEINNGRETIKLPVKEAYRLEELVGQQRKALLAPYANDMANFEGEKKVYSQLSEEEKLKNLDIIYDEGFKRGKELFLKEHPQYIATEKTGAEKKDDKQDSRKNKKLRKALKRKSYQSSY